MVGVVLSSCTNVSIKDSEWCGSLAANGAACFHTLTSDSRSMTLQEFSAWWVDLKDPKVATSVTTLTNIKEEVETLCTYLNGACSAEIEAKVDSISEKLKKVVQKVRK